VKTLLNTADLTPGRIPSRDRERPNVTRYAIRTVGPGAAVFTLTLALLSGCGADTASGTPADRTPDTPRTPIKVDGQRPVTALPQVPDGHVRVTGIAFKGSGGTAIPQEPFERGTIVVMPADYLKSYLRSLNPDVIVGDYLPDRFVAAPQLIRTKQVKTCDIEADGTFGVWLAPGRYAFCLGNLAAHASVDATPGSVDVEKWFDVTVTDEELQAVIPIFNRETGELTVLH
jgi:hypothetical protein